MHSYSSRPTTKGNAAPSAGSAALASQALRIAALAAATFLPVLGGPVPGRYIVELTEPVGAEHPSSESGARRRDNQRGPGGGLVEQQRLVRRLLENHGAVPYESLDRVANALLVRMPERLAAAVGGWAGVRRVYPVYEMKLMLERAMPRHSVPQAWTRLGGPDLAGAGVKIGIIDSGIDAGHPGFQDSSIPMPEGYPRVNRSSDLAFTSNKVIVARSYLSLLDETDSSAGDRNGHGTAVAMAAAGVVIESPGGRISGAAPKAWLGNYNVIRESGSTRSDIVLKALDDAARDGMNVINLSLGSPVALRPGDEILTRVFERLAALGIVVVAAAGNEGSEPFSLGDTSVPYAALAVGSVSNDREIGGSVTLAGGRSFDAVPGDGPRPVTPLTGPLFDVAQVDPSGLACGALPAGSLAGRIGLILRGDCFFRDKLNNAQAAGAAGVVFYTHAQEPQPFVFSALGATLPAVMVSNAGGLAMKSLLGANTIAATVDFRVLQAMNPNRIASFSSRGPNTDFSIKPDLVAVGTAVNTATLDGSFNTTQGTSFSAPIVAGAAAVVMARRPGYSVHHYRSLLVNTADTLLLDGVTPAPVQAVGGGVLNLDRALEATVAAYPTALSYGDTTGPLNRRLVIANLGAAPDTYSIAAEPADSGPPPSPSITALTLPAGGSGAVELFLAPQGLAPGEYQGYLRIRGSKPGAEIRVPYWYGIRSREAAAVGLVFQDEAGRAGDLLRSAIGVRVTDSAGLPILDPAPTVETISGGGTVVSVFSSDETSPGLFQVTVRLGVTPGANRFRIQAGSKSLEVTIDGE